MLFDLYVNDSLSLREVKPNSMKCQNKSAQYFSELPVRHNRLKLSLLR